MFGRAVCEITKQVSTSVVLFGLTQCGHMATLIWVNIGSDNYLNQCWLLISDVIFYSLEINFKASTTMLLFCTTSLKIIHIFLNYCHISGPMSQYAYRCVSTHHGDFVVFSVAWNRKYDIFIASSTNIIKYVMNYLFICKPLELRMDR